MDYDQTEKNVHRLILEGLLEGKITRGRPIMK